MQIDIAISMKTIALRKEYILLPLFNAFDAYENN